MPTEITFEDAMAMAAGQPGAVFIDVRTPEETMQLGHLPGAWLLPMLRLRDEVDAIAARSGPKFVVCEHGVRSWQVAGFLDAMGIEQVYTVAGGMSVWPGERQHGAAG